MIELIIKIILYVFILIFKGLRSLILSLFSPKNEVILDNTILTKNIKKKRKSKKKLKKPKFERVRGITIGVYKNDSSKYNNYLKITYKNTKDDNKLELVYEHKLMKNYKEDVYDFLERMMIEKKNEKSLWYNISLEDIKYILQNEFN